jgi:hypothetical protein
VAARPLIRPPGPVPTCRGRQGATYYPLDFNERKANDRIGAFGEVFPERIVAGGPRSALERDAALLSLWRTKAPVQIHLRRPIATLKPIEESLWVLDVSGYGVARLAGCSQLRLVAIELSPSVLLRSSGGRCPCVQSIIE